MKKLIIYIHGKGGTSQEAEHYKSLCSDYDVFGFDYKGNTPWETEEEFQKMFDEKAKAYGEITVIANSIGAYFTVNALQDRDIAKALFISPIVNMEKLICDMMIWASVSEKELFEKGEIETDFGETLSWIYLCYVREKAVKWTAPTEILYGDRDNLTSLETVTDFAEKHGAGLTVMSGGEHWFHTEEQMKFLDEWIRIIL